MVVYLVLFPLLLLLLFLASLPLCRWSSWETNYLVIVVFRFPISTLNAKSTLILHLFASLRVCFLCTLALMCVSQYDTTQNETLTLSMNALCVSTRSQMTVNSLDGHMQCSFMKWSRQEDKKWKLCTSFLLISVLWISWRSIWIDRFL